MQPQKERPFDGCHPLASLIHDDIGCRKPPQGVERIRHRCRSLTVLKVEFVVESAKRSQGEARLLQFPVQAARPTAARRGIQFVAGEWIRFVVEKIPESIEALLVTELR